MHAHLYGISRQLSLVAQDLLAQLGARGSGEHDGSGQRSPCRDHATARGLGYAWSPQAPPIAARNSATPDRRGGPPAEHLARKGHGCHERLPAHRRTPELGLISRTPGPGRRGDSSTHEGQVPQSGCSTVGSARLVVSSCRSSAPRGAAVASTSDRHAMKLQFRDAGLAARSKRAVIPLQHSGEIPRPTCSSRRDSRPETSWPYPGSGSAQSEGSCCHEPLTASLRLMTWFPLVAAPALMNFRFRGRRSSQPGSLKHLCRNSLAAQIGHFARELTQKITTF